MKKRTIIPIILCGGIGTRLWPLSRASFPKQFLHLLKDQKFSMLQNTYKRILKIENISDPILICNEEHRFIVAEQMREINAKPRAIILEPNGRNTCPAITLGALKALHDDKNSIILVLSADHKINDDNKFVNVINSAYEYADRGKLVTFGIIPTSPETGFGYIKSINPLQKDEIGGCEIEKFIEKPDKKIAEKLYKDKKYTWNSGIFMFNTALILEQVKKYSREIHNLCEKAIHNFSKDLDFIRVEEEHFNKCPNLSIDIAVMEKTNLGIVIPLDVGWSDIGSWKSLWENDDKDLDGNILIGKVLSEKSNNCYLRSEQRLLVALGLKDIIVVETSDAVMVADKESSHLIKNILQTLENNGLDEAKEHKKIYRPWGNYISVVDDLRWQVKRIEVKAGGKLSLQMHHHRAEHWIVVIGTAKVEIDNKTYLLSENQSTYIPVGTKHRLSNPGKIPLVLIEVQSGSYLGEDDITRFDDNYGRVNLDS